MYDHISKIGQSFTNHPIRFSAVTGIVGIMIGGGVGYILGRKIESKIEKTPSPQLEFDLDFKIDDPEDLTNYMSQHNSDVEKSKQNHPSSRISDIKDIDVDLAIIDEGTPEELVITNVAPENDWNYLKEKEKRSEDEPYILHRDEFYDDQKGYSQITLTYYSGDNIMADEEDTPVYNHTQVTGPLNFGHGSGDPNVVYVRNDKRKAEYEIVNVTGTYSEEVLGLEIENNERVRDLKHAKLNKFRDD